MSASEDGSGLAIVEESKLLEADFTIPHREHASTPPIVRMFAAEAGAAP
jgi:hypothetical protein